MVNGQLEFRGEFGEQGPGGRAVIGIMLKPESCQKDTEGIKRLFLLQRGMHGWWNQRAWRWKASSHLQEKNGGVEVGVKDPSRESILTTMWKRIPTLMGE